MRAFQGGSRAPAMSSAALRIVVRYKCANYWRNLNLLFAGSLRVRATGPVTGARLACGRSWAAGDPVVSDLTGGLRAGAAYPCLMGRQSESGLPVEPVYGPGQPPGFDPAAQLGSPGEFPFTRGIYP